MKREREVRELPTSLLLLPFSARVLIADAIVRRSKRRLLCRVYRSENRMTGSSRHATGHPSSKKRHEASVRAAARIRGAKKVGASIGGRRQRRRSGVDEKPFFSSLSAPPKARNRPFARGFLGIATGPSHHDEAKDRNRGGGPMIDGQ